ncbi:MAG: hypothetical protein KatS3mg015_2813 [Fimbriimonadales bacterium]|nr:MAG: hypothetical protein KatS3mg015_2813 [Fimbriimonadales bacterium]
MKPVPLQNLFSNGMKRDMARNRMPPNSVWGLRDFVLDYGAPARERNGWAYASSDVSSITGSAGYIRGGIYSTFSLTSGATEINLAIDEDGYVYKVALSGTPAATGVGAGVPIAQNPVFHGGTAASAATAVYTGLVIIPDGTGASVPKKYDGTTLSDLNGSPPKAKYATVFKDYTCLGHGTVGTTLYPNRIWFSPPGDPDCGFSGSVTAWDTTDSWIDFSLPIIGLSANKNVLLVFHDGQVSRIRGNTPPPEEDMVVDDPWQRVGLLDPFSITEYQEMIYWCAPEGVYRTDGVSLDDITLKGGMLRYWLDLVANATSTWTFATGIIRNHLIISVMDGATFKDAFIINLHSYAWGRLSNLRAVSFWTGQYGNADETYFGLRSAPRVGRLNTMFLVDDATYKNDGDGTAVASEIELPFYELGRPGIKTVKAVHIGYYLKDFANDNPTFQVAYTTTPESSSYTVLDTLAENTSYNRARVTIGGRMYGLGLKFTRTNAGDFHGFDLSAEVGFQEESKRMS